MKWCRNGVTREVFLIWKYAIKIPKLTYGWSHFLEGLLANMREACFADTEWPELCPVLFAIPGGFLIVMPRVRMMTEDEWLKFDDWAFRNKPGYIIPCESKPDSYGWLGDKVVAIDYGN